MILPFQAHVLGRDPKPQKKSMVTNVGKFCKKRVVIAKEWCLSIAQMPQGYIWLPFSCCFAPPTVHLTNRRSIQEAAQDPEAMNKFALNFGLLIEGVLTTLTGACCCCGCFTACSPEEVYDHRSNN